MYLTILYLLAILHSIFIRMCHEEIISEMIDKHKCFKNGTGKYCKHNRAISDNIRKMFFLENILWILHGFSISWKTKQQQKKRGERKFKWFSFLVFFPSLILTLTYSIKALMLFSFFVFLRKSINFQKTGIR